MQKYTIVTEDGKVLTVEAENAIRAIQQTEVYSTMIIALVRVN